MAKIKWVFDFKVDGGYRFWEDKKTNRIAVADNSMDRPYRMGYPEETFSSILWLDFDRPIVIENNVDSIKSRIPVIDNNIISVASYNRHGEVLIESFQGGIEIAYRYNMKLKMDEKLRRTLHLASIMG